MNEQTAYTLVNPQNGNLAFKILNFQDHTHFDHIQRNNYYSLIWILSGSGELKADFSQYTFDENSLMAFSPYQPFMLSGPSLVGKAIFFHPDFFCIHKHQTEVACHGVLFNNIYQSPCVTVDETSSGTLNMLVERMAAEMKDTGLAQYEILVSYLKIFLITASRLKTEQHPASMTDMATEEPFILQTLKDAIEKNFKQKHAPSEYADSLNISTRALARITKNHFNKTLTELISERILIEAKRELYLTRKSIKEIAYELGYEDEHYFSRFFKTNAEISPQVYRETVGFGRGVQQ